MGKPFLENEGDKYDNFVLVNYKVIDELNIVMRELIHSPSGAQVMHLENDDPENLFCLSFKTLPKCSDGAPHILEHTVLCGSRKFPVKDPFFSMNRRSLNTFMNALTGSDFTCYPAATQVEKDFYNLLEVYLDAVFHPLLKEMSFLQEGHRLEFKKKNDPRSPLEFKGIVYNEMKGAMASVDSRIWQEVSEALTPDLPYAFNSGGDPAEIPKLTYADLIAFHEMYYHPSRCLFFFYGNFPLKKHLDFIAEHALHSVEKLPPLDGIGHQGRFTSPMREKRFYPTTETEDLESAHIHVIGWLTTQLVNQEDLLGLSILDAVLMDTDASPLKKALLDTELCISVDCFLDAEMTEIPLVFIFRGCKEDAGKKLEKVLFEQLEKIAKEGLPYHLIEAAIHQIEFSRTEIGGDHSPFGLTLFMRSALAKQHGCAPENALMIHSLFEHFVDKAKDPRLFSPLIEKYLLNNPHYICFNFAPDPNLPKKEVQEEQKTLEKIKSELNEKQIAHILEQTKKLEEFQAHQEGQKLNCLPKVTLSDVPREAQHFPLTANHYKNFDIHHHDTFTNHILYADLFFDLPNLTEEELFDLQIFLVLWPELGAGKRSYIENLEFIHAHTGGIGAHTSLHVQASNSEKMHPSLQLHGKALGRKADKLFEVFQSMLTNPHFTEKKRIEELIKKLATSMQNRLTRNAMRYASLLSLQSFSLPSHINQMWHGLSFYHHVQKTKKAIPKCIERLERLKNKLLTLSSPHLVLSCDQKLYDQLDKKGFYGLCDLPSHRQKPWELHSTYPKAHDEARIVSSPVAFTAFGFKTVSLTHKDSPAIQVSTVLMENKILHHRIREQGGAYGSGANYNPLWGNFYFFGYRDPKIAHTLHSFSDAVSEIGEGAFNDQDLEEAKLGIIQNLDSPTSPGNRGATAYVHEREGKTRQIRQNFRDQLLKLTKESIQSAVQHHLIPHLESGVVATFAGKELLDKELPLLKNRKIEPLPITAQ